MTCQMPIAAADVDALQCSAMGRAMANPALAYGPALNIAAQRNSGALNDMIAARCRKLKFRSNESRKKFLAVHRALATCLGDA